jgi:hypothetical protein
MTDVLEKRLVIRAAVLAAVAALLLGACRGADGGTTLADGPTTIAEGTGTFRQGDGFATVKLSATEDDGEVSGEANVTGESGPPFTIAVECSGKAADGVVIVAGKVSASEDDERPVGTRTAVLVKDGDPDGMLLWFEDPPPAGSCSEFVENIPEDVLSDPSMYQPVDGDIKTG